MLFLTLAIDTLDVDNLIKQIAKGDKSALSDLYAETRAAVYGFSLSITKNRDDSEDVLQDTYIKVWQNAGNYQAKGTPMAWILSITKNLSLMKLREHGRKQDLAPEDWDALFHDADPTATIDDRHLLEVALTILSDEEREVVLLHAISGLKHREIADLLNIALATVLSKYHRGLKKLRNYLESMQ